jgi:CBS domain containing-hemolysin-like protein
MNYEIFVIIITIIFSAFFSGMEIAFVSSNKIYLEIEKKQNSFFSNILKKITRSPSKFLATMLVGNNIALVIYGLYSGKLILELLFPEINSSDSLAFSYIFYQTLISTFVILITAEFLPKVLFQIYANILLKYLSFPSYFFYVLLSPITFVLNSISNSVLSKYFKTKEDELRIVFSKDELGDYINEELAYDSSSINIDSEIQIFQNALEFSNVKAREIMVPRAEIISADRYISLDGVKEIFVKNGLSKILMFTENIDHIIGCISLQDVFKEPENIKSIINPVEFIPEAMLINDVLNLLTKKRRSIAVVIDEYGGTSGIITIEDIIEELFGEIEDEHDSQIFLEKKVNENSYVFSARLEVNYINNKYKLKIPESDQYETVGGFIVHKRGDIPAVGEVLSFTDYTFKIKEVTNTKIETVELMRIN